MSQVVGVWDCVESDNFDEYLKKMNVGFVMRKAAGSVKPTLNISNDGANWTFKMTSTFKNQETKFTDGVAFDEQTLDGRSSTNVIKSDGPNKLVQTSTIGDLENKIVREVVDNRLIVTMEAGGVVAKRVYKRTA